MIFKTYLWQITIFEAHSLNTKTNFREPGCRCSLKKEKRKIKMTKITDMFGTVNEVAGIRDIVAEKDADLQIHTLKVLLADEDWNHFIKKANNCGRSPSALIQEFINDLVYGKYSNGSDEEMYANQWNRRMVR